ncbi:MAG: OmpA family protein, partial [FCB group bacterium]
NPILGLNQIDAIAIADTQDTIKPCINLEKDMEAIPEAEHLSKNINSEFSDLCPVISPDGKTLYFTRDKHPENIGTDKNEDIWYAKAVDNDFEKAKNLGPPINNKWNNFAFSISPDGNALLLGNAYYPNDSIGQGVSISYFKGDNWSFPKKLEIQNYYNLHKKYVGFFLAGSGKVLLSTLERDDSQGGMDLYASFLQNDGTWSEPLNLGTSINTAADEATPFLAADDVSLYFSTAGRCGYGSNDMFVSRRLDSTWTKWSEPVNLGPKLNTPGWDAYYTIPASGEYAYFVSTTNSYGQEDIFRVKLPESLRPKPVVLISGRVLNANNEPVDAKIVYETLPSGMEAGIARSNPKTGEYKIALPAGAKYGFLAEAQGFIAINENLDLQNIKNYQEITRDLHLVPIEQGQTIRINNIFFEFGKYELLEDSYSELNRIVSFLKDNPNVSIQINGHTDNIGPAQRNLTLSKKRAEAVSEYLISKGIINSRLKIKGFGQTKPIEKNNTEEGRSRNRRVEFVILNK